MEKIERKMYDCIIVGGGVVGTFAARELSRFRGNFLLLEAGNDVAVGTTKANSGIVHSGFDALPGTLKAKYNVLGSRLMEKKCLDLEVPYNRCGALVLAFDGAGKRVLGELRARAMTSGVDVEILPAETARAIEPKLSDKINSALFAPSSAIVSPYELAIACYENFIRNGGEARMNSRVVRIVPTCNGYELVTSGGQTHFARTVINAAGLFSDVVHNGVTGVKRRHKITPRRGQYMLLDKTALPVSRTIFQTPTALGKGVLVTPTCHGNTLIGPNAEDIDDKTDVATTAGGLDDIFERARLSVPSLSRRDIITQFAGNRAVCGDDFIIGESADGFYDCIGIASPGLASSPAIAEYLARSVAQKLGLDENETFDPHRAAIPCFAAATDSERDALIAQDPRYGHIVCRCETVTEGEIAEAVKRGAVDLDGVKRRVRAGMGRCQAGFCTPKLLKIMADALGVAAGDVTKSGGGSKLVR